MNQCMKSIAQIPGGAVPPGLQLVPGCSRVLHITGTMDCAGIETFLMNVGRELDHTRLQFDFLVWDGRQYDYEAEIVALGGRIYRVPSPRENLAKFASGVRAVVERNPFAAIHSHVHCWNGICLWLAMRAGIDVRIAHSHSTSSGHDPQLARRALNYWMRRLMLRCATHLFGPSKAAGLALYGQAGCRDPRFAVVPNAISVSSYENPTGNRSLRDELHIAPDDFVLGHVGRFDEVKNHSFLVSVLNQLRNSGSPAHLVVVGRGELENEFRRSVHDKGLQQYVHMLGVRRDIPQILPSFDVFVFPSLYEGLGMVAVEAQAAGIPVLASCAVPPEADLGLGLLRRIPLDRGAGNWSRELLEMRSIVSPAWLTRKSQLASAGYDAQKAAAYLQSIYLKQPVS